MSQHLLPVRTGNEQFPVQYRNVYSLNLAAGITTEHNAILYILKQGVTGGTTLGKAYLYTLNLFNGVLTKYAEFNYDTDLGNYAYIGGMLVDDDYIYFTLASGLPRVLIFKQRDPTAADATMQLERVGIFSYYTDSIQCYGKIAWYDENHICLITNYGVSLFHIHQYLFEPKPGSSSIGFRDFAVGDRYVMLTTGSNTSYRYNRSTNEYSSFNLSTSGAACVAYNKGKFYFTNVNYLHIYDEISESIEITRNIAWTTPRDVHAYNGVVYLVSDSSARAYIYDATNDQTQTYYMPWTLGQMGSNNICRACVSEGYWFLINETLMIADYTGYSKYNFGYKYESITVMCNRSTMLQFTYDPRFVTFEETFVSVHDGDIDYPLTPIEEGSDIKSTRVSKSDYKFLNRVQFKSE